MSGERMPTMPSLADLKFVELGDLSVVEQGLPHFFRVGDEGASACSLLGRWLALELGHDRNSLLLALVD